MLLALKPMAALMPPFGAPGPRASLVRESPLVGESQFATVVDVCGMTRPRPSDEVHASLTMHRLRRTPAAPTVPPRAGVRPAQASPLAAVASLRATAANPQARRAADRLSRGAAASPPGGAVDAALPRPGAAARARYGPRRPTRTRAGSRTVRRRGAPHPHRRRSPNSACPTADQRAGGAEHHEPSRSRRGRCRTRWTAATCSAGRRPARVRRSRSGCPCWPGWPGPAAPAAPSARRRAAWCWCPRASWPSRWRTCSRRSAGPSASASPPCTAGCRTPGRSAGLRDGVDIVVATPGRLIDLLDRGACTLAGIEISVLDEADHMADLGFLPAVTRILDETPAGGQRLLFSATLDRRVGQLVTRYLTDPALHAVAPQAEAGSAAEHSVLVLDAQDKLPVAAEIASQRLDAVLRPHQARRGAAGQAADPGRGGRRGHPRQPEPEPAAAGAGRVRRRAPAGAGGHRRRRARHPRRRRGTGRALRPAERSQGLPAPVRPDGPAGASGLVVSLAEEGQVRELQRMHDAAGVSAPGTTSASATTWSRRSRRPARRSRPRPRPRRPGGARGGANGAGRGPVTRPASSRTRRDGAARPGGTSPGRARRAAARTGRVPLTRLTPPLGLLDGELRGGVGVEPFLRDRLPLRTERPYVPSSSRFRAR